MAEHSPQTPTIARRENTKISCRIIVIADGNVSKKKVGVMGLGGWVERWGRGVILPLLSPH